MMQLKASKNVVQALSTLVSAEAISSSDGKKLTALLQSGSDDDDTGAPAGSVFENQSGAPITDALNGLLEKANAQLEDIRDQEKSNLRNYEMLHMSFTDQIKYATKEL